MPIVAIEQDLCNGCGICEDVCPMDVIRIEKERAEICYLQDCHTCFQCEEVCESGAIKVSAIISGVPTPY